MKFYRLPIKVVDTETMPDGKVVELPGIFLSPDFPNGFSGGFVGQIVDGNYIVGVEKELPDCKGLTLDEAVALVPCATQWKIVGGAA